jgi:hypothetical protein
VTDQTLRALGIDGESVARRWLALLDVELAAAPAVRTTLEAIALERLAGDIRRASHARWSVCYNRAGAVLGLPQGRVEGLRRTLRGWRRSTRLLRNSTASRAARDYLAQHPTARPQEVAAATGCTVETAERISGCTRKVA